MSDVTLSPGAQWAIITNNEWMNVCVFSEVRRVLGGKEFLQMLQVYQFLCYWTLTFDLQMIGGVSDHSH